MNGIGKKSTREVPQPLKAMQKILLEKTIKTLVRLSTGIII